MTRDEAIEVARREAEEQRLPWGDTVIAHRIQGWPRRPYWKISAIDGGELAGFDTPYTFALVQEETKNVQANLVRPWSDYSIWRWCGFILGFFLLQAAFAVCVMRFAPNPHVLHIMISVYAVPFYWYLAFLPSYVRQRGRCKWLLRSDVRKEIHGNLATGAARASH